MHTSTGEAIGFTLSTVPAFLTKLWTLVDDASTDELICWDVSGKSFHVLDQARFAKEILPLYFKHNNIASFIRQLNMYGFRKIVNTEAINVKLEKDDMEFAHPYFVKDQEHLLELIKRKVPTSKLPGMGNVNSDDIASKTDEMRHVLSEVNAVKGRQDSLTSKLESLKLENDVLWREVVNLRRMHMKQQQVVNKLIQFLLTMVGNKRHLMTGVKRKGPLMLGDSTIPPKITRGNSSNSLEKCYQVQSPLPSPSQQASQPAASVVIDDVTELLNAAGAASLSLPSVASVDYIPTEGAANLNDVLEPLAVLDEGCSPSLKLTDLPDDDDGIGMVNSLAVDEILQSSPSDVLVNETLGASTSNSVLQPNSTRTVAVADSLKPPRSEPV